MIRFQLEGGVARIVAKFSRLVRDNKKGGEPKSAAHFIGRLTVS